MAAKKKKPPRKSKLNRAASTQEIAEQFDVHEQTVREWAHDGCPHDPPAGPRQPIRFDPTEVAAWLQSNGRTGKVGRPKLNESPDLDSAKLAKEREMAENWRLRNETLRGELVNKEDYRRHWMSEVTTIKNKCRGLGAAIAPQCVGLDAGEIQSLIDTRVEQIFRELSE